VHVQSRFSFFAVILDRRSARGDDDAPRAARAARASDSRASMRRCAMGRGEDARRSAHGGVRGASRVEGEKARLE